MYCEIMLFTPTPDLQIYASRCLSNISICTSMTYVNLIWPKLNFPSLISIQSQIFIGRMDAEAETPILWPPDAKSQLLGKDPDAGKD